MAAKRREAEIARLKANDPELLTVDWCGADVGNEEVGRLAEALDGNTVLQAVDCRRAFFFEKAQHVVLSDEWQSDRHGIVGRKVAAMGLGGVTIGAGAGTVRHERYTVIFVKWMATVG